MKKILLVLLITILSSCVTNATREEIQSLRFTKDLPGKKQSEIFDKTLEWGIRYFGSAKSAIDIQDKTAGKIVANRSIPTKSIQGGFAARLEFQTVIYIKDGFIEVFGENYSEGIAKYKLTQTGLEDARLDINTIEQELIKHITRWLIPKK